MSAPVVTVYTKPACPQCNATKKALAKFGLEYTEAPIDDQVLDAAMELDIASAPIVCASVDGVEVEPWGGYRPDRIQALAGAA